MQTCKTNKEMQEQLTALALSHFKKNIECRTQIRLLTTLPVYVLIHQKTIFHGSFINDSIHELSREYLLADQLLELYPYLKKYPNWKNLFERDQYTNVYVITQDDFKWLRKQQKNFVLKQRLI